MFRLLRFLILFSMLKGSISPQTKAYFKKIPKIPKIDVCCFHDHVP